PHKNSWSARINHPILLELTDETPVEVAAAEKDLHTVDWVPQDKALSMVTFDNNKLAFDLVLGIAPAYTGTFSTEREELVNSGEFSGMESNEAKQKIAEHARGQMVVKYKLRDWVFSRQRYWGEPIPLIHCEKCGVVPVPENELPVLLPDVESYEPSGTGESPLAAISGWVNTSCPQCGGSGKRETNTMPQWAGSSWYHLRYMDPANNDALVDPAKEKYWAPVDLYVGGAEHATRHLIYARFWHKFLYDIGVVSTKEPFMELHSVGLILAEDGRKMSKRYGNVVNPDDIVAQFGADSLRVYEMFMGPFDNAIAWSTDSLVGARRFMERVWKYGNQESGINDQESRVSDQLETLLNQTIKKVGEDIENFKMNTAVSSLMILLNAMEKEPASKTVFDAFLRLLAPLAPHVTEELWAKSGHTSSIHTEAWPQYDSSKIESDTAQIVVQINGKVRGSCSVKRSASEEEVASAAREAVADKLGGAAIARTVVVPGRLVNFVLASQ
ncbi:MAG TPA: class I tRNA ligase family protein, partial [Candidatus Paceibacterota bacterium]